MPRPAPTTISEQVPVADGMSYATIEFERGLLHDLQNLLMSIGTNVDELLASHSGEYDRTISDDVWASIRCSSEIASTLSAMRQSRTSNTELYVDINDVVSSACRIVQRGTRVVVHRRDESDAPQSTIAVFGDRLLLFRLVLNLVWNAVEASFGGSNPVDVCTYIGGAPSDPIPLLCAIEARETLQSFAIIRVSDTGMGMDESQLANLFTNPQSTKEIDRGLGLTVVRDAIYRHRGQLSVQSVRGKGTTFFVYLPLFR